MPSDVIKLVKSVASHAFEINNQPVALTGDKEADLDYVPENHDPDIALHANPIDQDELIDLLGSVNHGPHDQGVQLDQDQTHVVDPGV